MKFNFDDHSLISAEQIMANVAELADYEKLLVNVGNSKNYNFPESFIKLPFDESNISKVLKLKNKVMNDKIKYVVVIGIGGSNLGSKAVYDALYGYADLVEPTRLPKMIFVETLQPAFTKKVGRLLQNEQALIVLVSKSGKTVEALSNYQILLNIAPKAKNNVVVITNDFSPLAEKAKKKEIPVLHIPHMVGGRFSVLSPVGLFPLACVGVDLLELCEGAMKAFSDIEGAKLSASIILAHYRNGKDILTSFFFDQRLESLGKWTRQLVSESLGKKDFCGNTHGITPEVSIGTTDMHSMLQLYLSGKNTRQFVFVKAKGGTANVVSARNGITDAQLLSQIYSKTKDTFAEKRIPYIEAELKGVNAKELGYYIQFKMLEILFLARLLKINAFDQPDVEDFKRRAPIKAPF